MNGFFFHDFRNSYIPNILHEIYYERAYAPHVEGRKDLTVVDLGANVGLVSYYLKDFAKVVYAVEPSSQHLECLNKMIEFNDIKNIKVCPYAISNETGTTKFYHNQNSTMFSLKDTVNDQNDFEEVKTLTLEDFVKQEGIEHIDFMKMDLEGFESEVVASDGFKNVANKIDRILGEWHTWTNASKDLFANTFKDLGFTFDWVQGTEASLFVAKKMK